MDVTVIDTKYFQLYLSALQIGVGILYVPDYKELHIHVAVFELVFSFRSDHGKFS